MKEFERDSDDANKLFNFIKINLMENVTTPMTTQDSKNIALMTWLGTLFFGFIPGLIFLLVKKEDSYIQSQSKEALNWSITATIGWAVSFILTFFLVGILGFFVLGVCHFVFCIMGAVSTSNGKNFKVPFSIRLIK